MEDAMANETKKVEKKMVLQTRINIVIISGRPIAKKIFLADFNSAINEKEYFGFNFKMLGSRNHHCSYRVQSDNEQSNDEQLVAFLENFCQRSEILFCIKND